MTPEQVKDVCGFIVSGGTCVLGISLSTINAWLTAASLGVSIAVGIATLWPHVRAYLKERDR